MIYLNIPPDQLVNIHAAAANYYESTFIPQKKSHNNLNIDHIEPLYPRLAHHWEQSENKAKSIEYFEKAGETAAKNGVSHSAVEFFSKAIDFYQSTSQGDNNNNNNKDNNNIDSNTEKLSHWELQLAIALLQCRDESGAQVNIIDDLSICQSSPFFFSL